MGVKRGRLLGGRGRDWGSSLELSNRDLRGTGEGKGGIWVVRSASCSTSFPEGFCGQKLSNSPIVGLMLEI